MSKGLGQTSNSSWSEPNSNLGGPKISLRSSNFRCVEPINWIRSVKKGFPNEAKYTLSYKFYFFLVYFVACEDRRFFRRLSSDDISVWSRWIERVWDPIHPDELNWARRRTFHELNSLSLVRLRFDVWPRPYFTIILWLSYDMKRQIWDEQVDAPRSICLIPLYFRLINLIQ